MQIFGCTWLICHQTSSVTDRTVQVVWTSVTYDLSLSRYSDQLMYLWFAHMLATVCDFQHMVISDMIGSFNNPAFRPRPLVLFF